MCRDRFINHLYTEEIFVFRDCHWEYVENEDKTLFSGHHKTKILANELPEWHVRGRFYKC